MSDKKKGRERIAILNDLARMQMGIASGLVITRGIAAMSKADQVSVLEAVINFDAFGPDNDPYGERDAGAFKHKGESIFWKIDYYDLSLEGGSPDPADPNVTARVLTIMLASEY